jgi:outer membrane immunogenic protein
MKGSLLGASTALLTVFGGAAFSADIPVLDTTAPEPNIVAPAHDWSGFYFGGHVGYGSADFEFQDPSVSIDGLGPLIGIPGLILGVPLERDFDDDGFLGGVHAGVDAQFGSWVVGVLGDFSWADLEGDFRSTASFAGGFTTEEGVSADLNWFGTGRGRLGWAFDRFLLYGTGGVAFGEVESAGDITLFGGGPARIPLGTITASGDETHVGWTAGAGVEGMLTERLSARLEYLYADLGEAHHEGPATLAITPAGLAALGQAGIGIPAGLSAEGNGDFSVDLHSLKLGLSYRF